MNEEEKTLVDANEPLVNTQATKSNKAESKGPPSASKTPVKVPGGVTVQGEDDEDDADDGEERLLVSDQPAPVRRAVPLKYHNRPGQSHRLKIALTILYIGLVFIVLSVIAAAVRAIVKHYKPLPPATISSSLEFGSPHSILTSEYPNDDKLPDIIAEYGRAGYALTEIYGPSDEYPLQGLKLAFENGFETHTLQVSEHMQYLTPTAVPLGKTIRKVSVYEAILDGPSPPLYYICGLVFRDENDNAFLDKKWSELPPCNEAKESEP